MTTDRGIRAIINGDDFGLAASINEGVLEAHTHGYLTSTTLSVAGPAAEAAVRAAGACPQLGVGLHLTLVDEPPLSDPDTVSSLLDTDSADDSRSRDRLVDVLRPRMHRNGQRFALRWLAGRINAKELRAEIRLQLQRATELGLTLTHLDSHDHVHVLPGVIEIVLEEMSRQSLRCLRIPLEKRPVGHAGWARRATGLGLRTCAVRAARVAKRRGFLFPDRFVGYVGAGNIDAGGLVERIAGLRPGVTELSVHPARGDGPPRPDFADWGYRWNEELLALTDPVVHRALERCGAQLINFGDLAEEAGRADPAAADLAAA